jgi:hypothetical protein
MFELDRPMPSMSLKEETVMEAKAVHKIQNIFCNFCDPLLYL